MPNQEELERDTERSKKNLVDAMEKERTLNIELPSSLDEENISSSQKVKTLALLKEWARVGAFATAQHPLGEVLDKCLEQVTGGKGNERHGNGKEFMDQPWKHIADTHGDGFLTGQAAKKLQEAQSFDDIDRWNREMYGVIAYTAMAILHRNNNG